ncbi:MAG: DMT family transporter, partial [Planctomycetaceae bacterium]|nr:DMT family transporter [Planctomycetaceae bacterium]
IGTAMFFAWSAAFETVPRISLTRSTIIALLYVGLLVSGFCFAANAWLLKRHGASQVSVFSFATPVCGVTLGVLLRGDQLSLWLALAGVCVAVGIWLTNRSVRR